MGKASMTDMELPEDGSNLTTETTQITIAEERLTSDMDRWKRHSTCHALSL